MTEWECPYCGSKDPHHELDVSDEIDIDVTCKGVNLMRDDGYGIFLDHSQFSQLVDHYESRPEFKTD